MAVLRDPRRHLQCFRYGGSHFPTWAQFQEAIEQLGYPASTPWLQFPHPAPEEYENYFRDVTEPQHFAARTDFIQRVLALR